MRVRLFVCAAFLFACDPALNMSSGPMTRRTIDNCPEAVDHLRACCPRYDSFLSCTVSERWEGAGSADLTSSEGRCLQRAECSAIENAVTRDKRLCGVSFLGRSCR